MIDETYRKALSLKDTDLQTTSPLVFAYIGDGVYDLAVREYVLSHFPGSINQINDRKKAFVCAHAQSEIMGYLIGQALLTDQEMDIYRRGRNQKSVTHSKNSSIQEYRRATGFEALIGYLYLGKQHDRWIALVSQGIAHLQALLDRQGEIRHVREADPKTEDKTKEYKEAL